jgi:hypothetical protein
MSRLWPDGVPIQVALDETGRPTTFTWDGQTHPVRAIANRWRVDRQWWSSQVWREYFKLTTETGWLVIIYQNLVNRRWYLQRLYD